MASKKDLYSILGVERTATGDEIKRAYRRLARTWHPDVNKGDKKAEEKFKEISNAFAVLGDKEQRELYDEFGDDALRRGFDAEKARAYKKAQQSWGRRSQGASPFGGGAEGFGGFGGFGDFTQAAESVDFSELFSELFGGQRASASPAQERGANIEATLEVSLKEAALGGERSLSLTRPVECKTCHGSGKDPNAKPVQCPQCKGKGSVTRTQRGKRVSRTCPTCHGSGALPPPPCPTCQGEGRVSARTRIAVTIPKGVTEGSRIRVAGQGGAGKGGAPAGDLLLTVKLSPHPKVRREGANLFMDLPISIPEAVLGAKVTVPTFDGPVELNIPPGSQNQSRLRLKGKGLPTLSKGVGDLYFVLQVRMPAASEESKEAAKAFEGLYEGDLRRDLSL